MKSKPDPRIILADKLDTSGMSYAKTFRATIDEMRPYLERVRPRRLPKNPVVRKKKDEPRA